jgi:hypothetical protein
VTQVAQAGYNGQVVVTADQVIVGAMLSQHPAGRTLLHRDSSSNPGDPIHYESNLVTLVRRFRQLEK